MTFILVPNGKWLTHGERKKTNISFISWRSDRTVVGFTTTYAISAYHL